MAIIFVRRDSCMFLEKVGNDTIQFQIPISLKKIPRGRFFLQDFGSDLQLTFF
jgi:hypothetical protein